MRILGYGVEPLPEGIFGRVAVEVGIYLYERLLQQVVRILGGCRTLQEQTPYGVAVAVEEVFDLRPGAIIDALDLRRPIYRKTAAYGHFGRELPEFTWEKRDKVEALQAAVARLS